MGLLFLGFIGGIVFIFLLLNLYSNEKPETGTTTCDCPVTKGFAASQLIGGNRFLQCYDTQLKRLAGNQEFKRFVQVLQKELSGREVTDTKKANRRIADYFYIHKANEKFPEVQEIVAGVLAYGKQASAHISIYYAMFLYTEIK